MAEGKGDLEVTVIAGRNLRSDGKAESTYCVIDLPGNKSVKTSTIKDKREPVWNDVAVLELMTLDNEELLIQVFGKRRMTSDKFLGQVQIPIKALTLTKEPQWYFLTDKPKSAAEFLNDTKQPQTLRKNTSKDDNKRKSTLRGKDKDSKHDHDEDTKTYITGEITLRLKFVHRYLRGKSKANGLGGNMRHLDSPSLSMSDMDSPLTSPSTTPITSPTLAHPGAGTPPPSTPASPAPTPAPAQTTSPASPTPTATTSYSAVKPPAIVVNDSKADERDRRTISPRGMGAREKSVTFDTSQPSSPNSQSKPQSQSDEAAQIENAFKEKLQLVKQRLEQKRELISRLTSRVDVMKSQNEAGTKEEEEKLAKMKDELTELEKMETEVLNSLNQTQRATLNRGTSSRQLERTKSQGLGRERRLTRRMERAELASAGVGGENARERAGSRVERTASEAFDNNSEEVKSLRHRIAVLELELDHEKKMAAVVASKVTLLEKENTRLEEEVQTMKTEGGDSRKIRSYERNPEDANGKYLNGAEQVLDEAAKKEVDAALQSILKIHSEVKALTKDGKDDLDIRKKEIEGRLKDVEMKIEKHIMTHKRVDIDMMERRLHKRQDYLAGLEDKTRKSENGEETEDELTLTDDDLDDDDSPSTPRGINDSRLDLLVVKLEKLDKLDELLRKIDNMKYMSVGGSGDLGGEAGGRGYTEMKQELAEIQQIIVDESGKFSEKEKEDANIRYEKIFTEMSQTREYKAEIAAQLEEKRKRDEPLNKAALEKMLLIYNAENINNDPAIKEKILKNPELSLIGLDPKAILAKHQNDFGQYLIRITDLDELRAIRASLPKFRNDQKRQLEWVEILESKIETVSKAPPKQPPPPKPATAKLWKPKPAPKAAGAAGGTDMFAELLAKRKKLGAEDEPEKPPKEKETIGSVKKLKLAPAKNSAAAAVTPDAPLSDSAPVAPPPPPPPMF